jgi:hypothetical protein
MAWVRLLVIAGVDRGKGHRPDVHPQILDGISHHGRSADYLQGSLPVDLAVQPLLVDGQVVPRHAFDSKAPLDFCRTTPRSSWPSFRAATTASSMEATTKPDAPSSTTSGTKPRRKARTGVPQDIASIITSPNGSGQSIGNSSACALPMIASTNLITRGRHPAQIPGHPGSSQLDGAVWCCPTFECKPTAFWGGQARIKSDASPYIGGAGLFLDQSSRSRQRDCLPRGEVR